MGSIPGCVDFASDLRVSKKCVSSMLDIVEVYQWYAGSRDVDSLPLLGVGGPGGAGFESGTDSIEGVQSLI